jgi:hypothetical protein
MSPVRSPKTITKYGFPRNSDNIDGVGAFLARGVRMIDRLSMEGSYVYVHAADSTLKTTKSFTHAALTFNLAARTVTFGQLPPVSVPTELELADGIELKLQLVSPNGTLRKQTRAGVLRSNDKAPGILRIHGMAKSPAKFSPADGWTIEVYKYRCYFSHPGLKTDAKVPDWLKSTIGRQRDFWNRLAYLCREARRKCSPVPIQEVVSFIQAVILPAINEFNDSLGRKRGKESIKHPAKLKVESPGLDALWRFVGELRGRIEKGRAVPAGLMEQIVAFAEQFKADYSPLNEFMSSLRAIASAEAEALGMRHFEFRPTFTAFKSALDRRKTLKASWSDGWPAIKYPDSPRADDWGLHYYFNKAGVGSELLERGRGVPGLTFGSPVKSADSGHENLRCSRRSARALREAEISVSGDNNEDCTFRFGVLQHRPLPPSSHLKQWSLVYTNGALWLCLTVERQRPLPVLGPIAAGLDIGWRRTEAGIRFGTLYEPASKTFRELTIDLQRSPKDNKDREPFRIDLGPNRWDKRNITQLLPDWKPGDTVPDTIETRIALSVRRSCYKDAVKTLLQNHLGNQLPAWFDRAGSRGLGKLQHEDFKDDVVVQNILGEWQKKDAAIGSLASKYLARYTRQLEAGQTLIAHDVCYYLQQKGVTRLIVEASFIAKVSQKHDNEAPYSLKNSQKYRHFAAVGRFVLILKKIAVKYGLTVDAHEATNSTRICSNCNHLNPATEKEQFICEECGRLVRQGHNASVNLSRFGTDHDFAEMALHAGRA